MLQCAIADATEIYVHNAVDTEAERVKLKKQKEQAENCDKEYRGRN